MDQPLVSILIPIHGHPSYLEAALTSVLLQTYTNIEIIILDPSSTDEIQILLEKDFLPYFKKIKYIKDKRFSLPFKAFQELLNISNGTYVNFLLEKDLFYPTKIEKMMKYFLVNETTNIKLITSKSMLIDRYGNLVDTYINTTEKNLHFDGMAAGNLLLKRPTCLGGISAPLFRKHDLQPSIGYFAEKMFYHDMMIATWLNLLSKGSCLLLGEPLIFEREDTDLIFLKKEIPLINEWIQFISLGKKYGFLNNSIEIKQVVKNILKQISDIILHKQYILNKEERTLLYEYKEKLDALSIAD
ncbi:glycosyltransferase family 2 protein [Bacillus thuringiensis]|uniref:glycosyltransferase family 2 protein n=1 Tax=Bacillus thuringiensis TaxID=1428 RepID=UPI0011A996A5|nr:glycosyltransferase family A protein [Bacillus thuringiensis]